MPLSRILHMETGVLGIWRLTDSVKVLSDSFSFTDTENEQFISINSERRQREFLAVRILLEQLTGKKYEIF